MVFGWQDNDIGNLNPNFFVEITDNAENITVRGRIISDSITDSASWSNKFEGTDVGSQHSMVSGILQSGVWSEHSEFLKNIIGRTLITKAQTLQVWEGLQPQSIDMEIEFRAFSDTAEQVEIPIQLLRRMMSPTLNKDAWETTAKAYNRILAEIKERGGSGTVPEIGGLIPTDISVNLYGKRFNTTYRIESMSESSENKKIDINGNRLYQVISLTLGSTVGLEKDDMIFSNYY